MNRRKIIKPLALFSVMMGFATSAFAQSQSLSLDSVFANGLASFEALISLIKFMAYIIGVFMIVGSIFKFAKLGKHGGQPESPKIPLVMFFSGVGIFALISTVSIATATMAMGTGPGDILASGSGGSGALASWSPQAIKSVLTFARLLGYIAFIRGWILLNRSAQPNGQPGMIFRSLTHIFGGVCLINAQLFGGILANSFAPGMNIPFFS